MYIDRHILKKSKMKRKNQVMVWIDYREAYDMVSKSWMINILKLHKIIHQSKKNYRENHEKLESKTNSIRKKFSWGQNLKRYLPGSCAITIIIWITIIPLNHIFRKYNLTKSPEKINHLMYVDDIKLFTRNEKEL